MQKRGVIFGIFLIIGILLFCVTNVFVTFDGYYGKIDWARSAEKTYSNAQYIFSVSGENEVTDFVISGDELTIVTIYCDTKLLNKTYYRVNAKSTYRLDKAIKEFQQNNQCNWKNGQNLFSRTALQWCVIAEVSDPNDNGFETFSFCYNGETYLLCYQIELP